MFFNPLVYTAKPKIDWNLTEILSELNFDEQYLKIQFRTNFGQILLWILSVGIWSDFFQKVSFGRYRCAIFFENNITLISTICGVLTRAHLADSWGYTAARISRAFGRRANFPVFWKTCIFDVLSWCPLSVKLQAFVSVWYCAITRLLWIYA